MRRRSTGSPLRIESLAGWVFADLLLALFIVGLGTQVTQIAKADTKPETKPTVKVGMKQDPALVLLDADVDALLNGSKKEKSEANRALRQEIEDKTQGLVGEQGALTMIWGCAATPDAGQNLARAAGRQLEKARPETFTGARERPLWDGSCDEGENIRLEIYLYTTKPAAD